MHVDTEDRTTLLPACHAAWIPAGHQHRLRAEVEEVTLRTIYFYEEQSDPPLFAGVHVFAIDQLGKEMVAYCERWAEETATDTLEASLLGTIREFVPHWCAEPVPLSLPAAHDSRLHSVVKHIHQNLADPLNIDEVAVACGMSRRTLMRLFSGTLGMKFGMYKRIARMIRATELLTEGSKSVVEVMYEVGYSSQGSFSRAFREMLGCTPGHYRLLSSRSRSLPLSELDLR